MCVLINILLFCNKTFYFWLAFSCIQYISNAKLISIMAFFFLNFLRRNVDMVISITN